MDQLISFLFVTLVYTVILYFLYERLWARKDGPDASTLTNVKRFCGIFHALAWGIFFSFGFMAVVNYLAGSEATFYYGTTFADRITSIPFLIGTIVPSFFMTMWIYMEWHRAEFGHSLSEIDSYIVKTFGKAFVLVLLAFWAGIELYLSNRSY